MTHQQPDNGNGKSVMKLTVPLPIMITAILSAFAVAAVALAWIYDIKSSIRDMRREMVVQDDFCWYSKQVAKNNPSHPIPDMAEYFREKRVRLNSESIGFFQ